jgi:hypothetical protein
MVSSARVVLLTGASLKEEKRPVAYASFAHAKEGA